MTLFQIKCGHYGKNYIFSIGIAREHGGYWHLIGHHYGYWTSSAYINTIKEL